MDIIETIYKLIKQDSSINTFNDNKELFKSLYYRNPSIYFDGDKVIDIYRYILSLNIDEYDEDFPYFNSRIYEDFNRYIMYVTQGVYSKEVRVDDAYVEKLFKLIDTYYEFQSLGIKGELNNLVSENTFIRDCTGSMIIILNSSFFSISNDNINKLMDYVKDNKYLMSIINSGSMGEEMMDRDYLFQYSSRFLFNSAFVSEENIQNDSLLIAIKEGKICDFKTLHKIIDKTNIFHLDYCFEDGLSSFVDMIVNCGINDVERFILFNKFLQKLVIAEQYRYILKFIVHDERVSDYMTKKDQKNIINSVAGSYVVNLKKEEIEYVLNNCDNSDLFLMNLRENLKNNEWDEDTRSYVESITKNTIDTDVDDGLAIVILDKLFEEHEISSNFYLVFAALKRILKTFLKDETLCVYVMKSDHTSGCAVEEDNYIKLSYDSIMKLVNGHNFDQEVECLDIFDTIFHEAAHIEQYRYMKEADMDDVSYSHYKENIILNLCVDFYKANYKGVSIEREAREVGAAQAAILFETFFPHMTNAIKSFRETADKEMNAKYEDRRIFELSDNLSIDDILDKLVSINPAILDQYPVLLREYNKDGSKKVLPKLS